MKFAKYLESESIPEWRKAYINYKGLKKRLTAIERVQEIQKRIKKIIKRVVIVSKSKPYW